MTNPNNNLITVFAETTYRNQYKKFGIKTDDRRRHMYIIGKTGMGKSTLMENMIIEDIRAGRGVAVVDPHGELAEKIIQFIPDHRVEDVVYFNPADTEHPIAFNIVEQVDPHLRHLVASGLIGVFKKLWADSWGPRLEYILRNAILAVLDYPDSTLLAVTRMLADKQFRKRIIETIQDPVVKAFWVKEFAGYADKFASEAVAPIQNKVGQFLSSSLVRNIIGQTHSSIDIREIMDQKKILIMNLSKGRIGEDNTQLLGAMMITKIQLAAMSRVDMPEQERNDFYLYVDEFQNFATDSFANILSEARKYRLNLIMGHQYIEQLSELVASAVFGNVGTLVTYRVGATDAETLVKEFTPVFTEEDLVNQPKFNFCLKLMIDGVASDPFTARSLPPLAPAELTGNESVVINLSRQKYSGEREQVEKDIAGWHDDEFLPLKPVPLTTPPPGEPRQAYAAAPSAYHQSAPVNASPAPAQSNYQKPAPSGDLSINGEVVRPATTSAPSTYTKPAYNKPAYSAPRQEAPKGFEVECSSCGKSTRITFEPDGIRPVFCKECLVKSKEDRKKQMDSRRQAKERELANLATKTSTAPTQSNPAPQRPAPRDNTANTRPASVNNNHSAPTRPSVVTSAPKATVSEPKAPELSLSDLSNQGARDFHGRPIVNKEPREVKIEDEDGEKVLFES